MFVRQLDYLVTLAREKHFARAAEVCCVSQPALSAAVRNLENELGVAIVQRGQRFQGFTPEGERILDWARQTLAALEGLKQEASLSQAKLSGTLRIGAIPTTMPIVSLLTGACRTAHPELRQAVLSLSTEEIMRRLDAFELDVGMTYLEDQRLNGFHVQPLYQERYMLLARDRAALDGKTEISWEEAAQLPMCLLMAHMQNRRIVDAGFRQAEVKPNVVTETDSTFAVYSHVRHAGLFSVVPHSLLCLYELRDDMVAIPLVPELSRGIGLISLAHDPCSPVVIAARNIAGQIDLQARFDAYITGSYQPITTND